MESILPTNVILGAGIAGISAAFHMKQKSISSVIYEKDNDWGGLCGSFTIDGFRFDRFVHFSFASEPSTASIFENSSPMYSHPSVSYNYWKGYWLKHPAQNNLFSLPAEEKVKIIEGFISRPVMAVDEIRDYGEWLIVQYGKYFAEHFPYLYTRKYWGREAYQLETKWVGSRMYSPNISEVLLGAFEAQQKNFYYTKFMNYPKKGGFRSILDTCRAGLNIKFNKKVTSIDTDTKTIDFADGAFEKYESITSSLPLPEMVKVVKNCPPEVKKAAEKLHWTCGYQVSLGFKRDDIAKHLWFYIYDENILSSRVYSPNLKSPDNVPSGCSSLQAEVFFSDDANIPASDVVLANTVEKLKKICGFTEEDLVVKDIRFEKYANVIFTPEIYEAREKVQSWLSSLNIKVIGRFGKWDYLWSHQAFESAI